MMRHDMNDSPTFPLYLLPTFSLPFRRRRPKLYRGADQDASSPDENAVPSLSSSPGSPKSPSSLRSYFPDLPSLGSYKSNRKTSALPSKSTTLSRVHPDTVRCNTCAADLGFVSQIVSKGFTGRHGRAYLVAPPSTQPSPSCPGSPVNDNITAGNTEADLINVRVGRPENRQLVTGQHVVADIWCVICETKLGWKYVDAREPAQKYKVGKFILETQRVVTHHAWEDVDSSQPGDKRSDNRWPHDDFRDIRPSSDLHDEDDGVIVFDSEDEDECEDIFSGTWDPEVVAKRRRSKVANIRR
ncbi:yippee zinc-binding/DNA-binding /Mis18, centromere assembly-domain-containing protein [Cercophora newfieldiana]|uniref:Yippee zinc-binding/DNA-binding /Mis18, centromere assembly-domain-containing protein n=1 Tax=Cercophora newfieldiana TaxID=92897 RepID=A0AA39YHG5_9PEZI|nr:yippee zinc-binding/DNA-binding /Mis18, centromere assembly-domain-containing protein [Cercophora newfieldiana]